MWWTRKKSKIPSPLPAPRLRQAGGRVGGDKLPYFCMLFPLPISPLPAGEGTNLLFTNSSIKDFYEFSCIPGFLITKFGTKWTKSDPESWILHENLTEKICKCNLVTEIKIIKSISYTISTKKAGFRELGTLIALNITKANRRGWIKEKIVLSSWGWLWSQRVVYGI